MVRFHATARGGDLPSSVKLQLRSVADAAVVREVVLQSGQAETSLVGAEEWELSVTTSGWWLLPAPDRDRPRRADRRFRPLADGRSHRRRRPRLCRWDSSF